MRVRILTGDCIDEMRKLPPQSIDAIVTDPPYPEIDRPYGRMTEWDWHGMMNDVIAESRRVLKPTGSAVFILQANSERVGRMRPWLWEFMAKHAREWNMVQDVWWWNPTAFPTVHAHRTVGLCRPSVKACVWLGDPSCYRNQDAVLMTASQSCMDQDREDRALRKYPSGGTMRPGRTRQVVEERGGSTPFNLLPISNADSSSSAGAHGHGAGTPMALVCWWLRYIVPPGGSVLDPFVGSGTVALAAQRAGMSCLGIERDTDYAEIGRARLRNDAPLFSEVRP